ncbi:MAG: MarR family transcriptional regulator [Phycisphaerales bacterium]|nr:MarR family transcriptional regulator [Phycisphaerales bacterium]
MRVPAPKISAAKLAQAQDDFLAAWGQMGPSWGISRTMAEVHALLYIGGRPMNADEVMDRLRISRGNASMTLRSLIEWGLVQRVHKRGDRKEYFEAEQDVWTIARTIIRERLRREILPVLATLYEIRDQTGDETAHAAQEGGGIVAPDVVAAHNQRLDRLLELVQMLDKLGERFVGSEGKGLRLAATVLSKVV